MPILDQFVHGTTYFSMEAIDNLINKKSHEQSSLKNNVESESNEEECSLRLGPLCQSFYKHYGHSRLFYEQEEEDDERRDLSKF